MVVKTSRPDAGVVGDFVRIAHRIVWCTLATVDRRGRPRSRVVHPYWECDGGGVTGWMFTRATSPKITHLAHRSQVSCSYWDPAHEIAVAECDGEIADDEATRHKIWDLFATAEEPLGYDPRILGSEDHRDESITVIRMTPWRLVTPNRSWQLDPSSAEQAAGQR
ncbi:pyridoxamine 5'-phosphate oxidase family protein [Actinomadura barringtoniae]|uniref:Pyridoxamine 5'-phosphate oxidase family protein n=1 Tax=Actinomadura barringtoniae TaxID=1427535 RepID=A0A939T8A1_9ACTN|nr:pyridoxamine 5'-phosphate oxidase family protein [Actinomadura barringtoniae]MBO2450112.1 pyridoxamine 5'-phosphate oxidase family protein [Actinomadura barringtoniae]